MKFCKACIDKRTCNRCNNQIIENKEFAANLNFFLRNKLPTNLVICLLVFK